MFLLLLLLFIDDVLLQWYMSWISVTCWKEYRNPIFATTFKVFNAIFLSQLGNVECWFFFFFFFNFLNPLRILLPYPQTAMNLHKSEQICYIYLQSNIVVSHHRIHLLPPRLKCSTFNVSIITIQRFYNHCNKLKKKVALNFPRLYFTQYVTCAVWLFVNVNVVACISR